MHRSSGGPADVDRYWLRYEQHSVFNSRLSSLPHRFSSDAGSFLAVLSRHGGEQTEKSI
jgi:hypothetical protein